MPKRDMTPESGGKTGEQPGAAQGSGGADEPAEVKQYVYHVNPATNQVLKVEELASTGERTEVPMNDQGYDPYAGYGYADPYGATAPRLTAAMRAPPAMTRTPATTRMPAMRKAPRISRARPRRWGRCRRRYAFLAACRPRPASRGVCRRRASRGACRRPRGVFRPRCAFRAACRRLPASRGASRAALASRSKTPDGQPLRGSHVNGREASAPRSSRSPTASACSFEVTRRAISA
jgi:hypothetical protein